MLSHGDTRKSPQPVCPRREHDRRARQPLRSRGCILALPITVPLQLRQTQPAAANRPGSPDEDAGLWTPAVVSALASES